MTAYEIQELIRYSGWATGKVLEAASALPSEDLTRDVGVSHKSIFKTLAHVYWADLAWHTRVVNPNEAMHEPETLSELKLRWTQLQRAWEEWADELDDTSAQVNIAFKSSYGGEFENPVWELVYHVVNHGTLHRGQVMAMIRQLGIEPPHTDFIFYVREREAERALADAPEPDEAES